MILEKSRQLVKLLDTKKQLGDKLKKAGGFKTRRDEIKSLITRIEPLVKTSSAFRNKGIGPVDVKGQARAFEEVVLEVISTVKRSPEAILQAKSFNKLREGGNTFSNDLQIKLNTLWINYTRSLLPDINNELLDVLGRLPSFSISVKRIRQIASEIAKFRDSLPEEERQIDKFNQLVMEMNNVWNGMGSDAVPPSVLEFLRSAVSSTGAPLDLLTDEVRRWLANNRVEASFKIKLSS